MTVAVVCPDAEKFARLAAGEANAQEMEQFAAHLEGCPHCARRMDAVGDQSVLVQALRAGTDRTTEDTRLAPLMARLEKMGDPYATNAEHTPFPISGEISTEPGENAALHDTALDFSKLFAPPKEPGEIGRLGAYRILQILGAGGMGVVFQAEDTVLKRRVALKAMRPEFASSASLRQRFLREARAAAALHHDHVVVIHQAGEEAGVAFLAMELLEGESLEARLKRGPLVLPEILRIGREIAEGLAAAHEHGLIHRDIKPGNIWLEGARGRVKILDFGLARAADADGQLTSAGAIVGTPAYMSPEQANAAPLDFRTDLFSLGCVLYRMCTGIAPFAGNSTLQILRAVAENEPKSPRELNPTLPPELSALVMRLLEKDRANRPESARAIAVELAAIGDNIPATPPTPRPASKFPRWLAWTGVAVVLLSLIPAGYWLSQIVIIRDKDGKEILRAEVPKDGRLEIVDGKKDDGKPADKKGPTPTVPSKKSPLDFLDASAIPPEECFDWQPKELVAVLGSHRQRAWDAALSVAISADGSRVAANGGFFCDFETGRQLDQSADWNERVGVWRNGKNLQKLIGHADYSRPTVSLDGKLVAMIHRKDFTVGLFGIQSDMLQTRGTLPAPDSHARASRVGFSHDGRLGVLASDGKSVAFWDVAGPAPRKVGIAGAVDNADAIRFAAKAPRMVVFNQTYLQVWRLTAKGAERESDGVNIQVSLPNICDVAISADGKRFVSGHLNGAVVFWEMKDGKLVQRNPLRPQPVASSRQYGGAVHFSPTGEYLTTRGEWRTSVWQFGNKSPKPTLINESSNVFGTPPASSFVSQEEFAACGWGSGYIITFWRVSPTGVKKARERIMPQPAYAALLSSESGLVLARYTDAKSNIMRGLIFDAADPLAKKAEDFEIGVPYYHNHSDLSANGRVFAAVVAPPDGKTQTIRLFDIQDGKGVRRYDIPVKGTNTPLQRIHLSRDGKWLAASWGNGPGGGQTWRLEAASAKVHWRYGRFSPDGKLIAIIINDRKLAVHDLESTNLIWYTQMPTGMKVNDDELYDVVFAPDGRHLLVANANHTVYILRLDPSVFAKK